MSALHNLFRRGATYWWRRTLTFSNLLDDPITLGLSLLTKELRIARGRAAAMTAKSEVVRMTLLSDIRTKGLSSDQIRAVFATEMRDYRNQLEHLAAGWTLEPEAAPYRTTERNLVIYETMWSAFAETGIVTPITDEYAETHLARLSDEEKEDLRFLSRRLPALKEDFRTHAGALLRSINVEPNDVNLAVALRAILKARAQSTKQCREDVGLDAFFAENALPGHIANRPAELPAIITPQFQSAQIEVPAPWRDMSPTQVAARLIDENPRMFEHRQGGKRAAEQVGEQTLRQIRWAAFLFEKSLPVGTPLWRVDAEDIKTFDKWLDKLPNSVGKSPADRRDDTSLEEICARAEDRVEAGEIEAGEIGLMVPTSNKHYRKLAQIHAYLCSKVPALAELTWQNFLQSDNRDDREIRQRISVEQGRAIFTLSPWTGCHSEKERLKAGSLIIHDSLFFVLLLVWYTGARREEICKLLTADVDCLNDIWFLRIDTTSTGRVKNNSARRCIAIADELIRLGFVQYVDAMKAAGESLLFPELEPAGDTKRKRGDVFYKIWWIYIRPLVPALERGQALHAVRHTVSDELKEQEVFVEHRNDLLGHQSQGGEGATRYPSAASLAKLQGLVNRIPVVTDHLAPTEHIRLLGASMRKRRPQRNIPK